MINVTTHTLHPLELILMLCSIDTAFRIAITFIIDDLTLDWSNPEISYQTRKNPNRVQMNSWPMAQEFQWIFCSSNSSSSRLFRDSWSRLMASADFALSLLSSSELNPLHLTMRAATIISRQAWKRYYNRWYRNPSKKEGEIPFWQHPNELTRIE